MGKDPSPTPKKNLTIQLANHLEIIKLSLLDDVMQFYISTERDEGLGYNLAVKQTIQRRVQMIHQNTESNNLAPMKIVKLGFNCSRARI